jgi:hypothetical protein
VLAEGLLAAAPLAGGKVVAAVTAGAGSGETRTAHLLAPVRLGEGWIGRGPGRSGRGDGRAEDGEQAEAADDDGDGPACDG